MIRSDALRFIFGIKCILKESDNTINMSLFNSNYNIYINEYNTEKASLMNNINGLNNKLNNTLIKILNGKAENTLGVYTISPIETNIDKCKYALKSLGAIYLLSGENKLKNIIGTENTGLLIAVKSVYKYPSNINNSINELINQLKSATDNVQIEDLYNNISALLNCVDEGNKTNVSIINDIKKSNSTSSDTNVSSATTSAQQQIKKVIDGFLNKFENKDYDLRSLNQKMKLIDELIETNIKIDDESIKSFINANKDSRINGIFDKYNGNNNIANGYDTESFNNIKKFICNHISENKKLGVKFNLSKDFNFDKTVNDIIDEIRGSNNTLKTNDELLKPIEAKSIADLIKNYKDDTTHSIDEFNNVINGHSKSDLAIRNTIKNIFNCLPKSKNLIISLFNNIGDLITSNPAIYNILDDNTKNWLNSLDDDVKKVIINSINDNSNESWKEWKSNQKIESDDNNDSQTINTNEKNKTNYDIDVILNTESDHNAVQESINKLNELVNAPLMGYNASKQLYMRLKPVNYIENIYNNDISSISDNDLSYLYKSLTNDNTSITRLDMIFKINNIIKNREFKPYNLGKTESIINKLLIIFSNKAIPKISLNNVKNMMKNGEIISGNNGNNNKESNNISYLDKGDNLNNINEVNDDALNMYMNVVEPNLYTRQSNIEKSMELCNKLINDNDSMKSFIKYIEHNEANDKFDDYCDSIIFFDNNYKQTIDKFVNKFNEVSNELKNGIENDVISILNNGDFENNEEIVADFINNATDEDISKLKNSIQSNYNDIITSLSKYILKNATNTSVFEHLLYAIMSDNASRNSKLNNIDDVVTFDNKDEAKKFVLNRINRASVNNTIPTTDENNNEINIDNSEIDLISNQLSNLYYYFGREGIDQIIMKLLSNCNYIQTSKMMSAVIKFILANNINIDKFISLSYNKYKLARSILSMSKEDLEHATGSEEGAKTLAKTISNIPDINAVSGNIKARSGANNSYFAGLFGTK